MDRGRHAPRRGRYSRASRKRTRETATISAATRGTGSVVGAGRHNFAPRLPGPHDSNSVQIVRHAIHLLHGARRGFICRPRTGVMRHMMAGRSLGLISCRQQSRSGIEWGFCGVSGSIMESCAISNGTCEINYLFPLYIYPWKMEKASEARANPISAPVSSKRRKPPWTPGSIRTAPAVRLRRSARKTFSTISTPCFTARNTAAVTRGSLNPTSRASRWRTTVRYSPNWPAWGADSPPCT